MKPIPPDTFFSPLPLHKSYITNLFKTHYTHEFCENFYDSEPAIPDEWLWKRFGPEDINLWENPDFLAEWKQLCKDYEPTRLQINNWQEPYFVGNWDMTQADVDEIAKSSMLDARAQSLPNKQSRFFVKHEPDGVTHYFWFGRDHYPYCDLCWVMFPKSKN